MRRVAMYALVSLATSIPPVASQTVLEGDFDAYNELAVCSTSIEGKSLHVLYDKGEEIIRDNASYREKILGVSDNINCPTLVSLRLMTPELNDEQRGPFCLVYDGEADTYSGFDEGERGAYLQCVDPSKGICERVNDSKDAALAIAGLGAGATAGASIATTAAGVTAVTHSSGAVILTGASGYIAGTLGTAGATLAGILTAPLTIAAATVSVVAIGSAVYACTPANSEEPGPDSPAD